MDIDSLLASDMAGFAEVLREIWESRPDLQQAYPDAGSGGLVRWAAKSGVLEYPDRLGVGYPPVPPQGLRATACGGPTDHTHLWTGTEDLHAIHRLWKVFGSCPWNEIETLLDFGCACGRMMRWWPHVLPGERAHGCDVRAAGPEWCAEHLPGRCFTNGTQPPLDLPDDSMDLVYSLSVFSPLNRESGIAWIQELARVCRPGGRILITTGGAFMLWVLAQSAPNQKAMRISGDLAATYLQRLARKDFVFEPISEEFARFLDGVELEYGNAFLNERFVQRKWSDHVRVVGHVPASLSLLQDLFVLEPV